VVTAVNMSKAQARALGITSAGDAAAPTGPPPTRTRPSRGGERRVRAVAVWRHRCYDCGEELVGEAASVRHLADNHHLRYELVLSATPAGAP
jgi:hypothetical protein